MNIPGQNHHSTSTPRRSDSHTANPLRAATPPRSTTPPRAATPPRPTAPPQPTAPPRAALETVTPPRPDNRNLETRAARLAPHWHVGNSCMGCGCAVQSGFSRVVSSANRKQYHCRACGWVLCSVCCPPGQSLELTRWVSSTKGHAVKTATQPKQKQVCKWCLHDQPGDKARAEVLRHQEQQATRVDDMRRSQVHHETTMAQLVAGIPLPLGWYAYGQDYYHHPASGTGQRTRP